jgi:hypothetical protein
VPSRTTVRHSTTAERHSGKTDRMTENTGVLLGVYISRLTHKFRQQYVSTLVAQFFARRYALAHSLCICRLFE